MKGLIRVLNQNKTARNTVAIGGGVIGAIILWNLGGVLFSLGFLGLALYGGYSLITKR